MPLDYADFAHHYEGSSASEAGRRAEFEVFASIMECLARFFWQDTQPERGTENPLGIRFDSDTLALIGEVDSRYPIKTLFNGAASVSAARKQET